MEIVSMRGLRIICRSSLGKLVLEHLSADGLSQRELIIEAEVKYSA
jgi:hypothetical protein